jgi:hypothetical protein
VSGVDSKPRRSVFTQGVTDGARSAELVVNKVPAEGWDVRESRNGQVVHEATYQNWHRVELEMSRFSAEAAQLKRDGWREVEE